MAEFWNIIVETNTFNFAILVVIFAILMVKLNVPSVLEKIKNDVASSIENARLEKSNAEKELKKTKKIVKNTDNEVQEKLDGAKLNAKTISNEINKTAKQQIEHIESNIERVLQSEEKRISQDLTDDTMQNAVELAKQTIVSNLNSDKNLHERFIQKSLDELSKVNL